MLIDLSDPRPVHFVGVAGAGMSALAELLVRRGATVSGCDNNLAGAVDLRNLGLTLHEGHDPAHVDGARAVVVTSAVPKNHPELERARALGIPVIRRAEALGEAVAGTTLVAVGPLAAGYAETAEGVESHLVETAAEAADTLAALVRPGDVVLIKGSRSVGLEAIAAKLHS